MAEAAEAIGALIDRDISYHGGEVRIAFASHGEAIKRMNDARRALEALRSMTPFNEGEGNGP
jgi:hypothetical protein